jgi:hypothetical protein
MLRPGLLIGAHDELRGWAEAASFEDLDVRNLGDPNGWELRLDRSLIAEYTTAAEAERWFGNIAREYGRQIEPRQIVAIV